jgi:antitoxin component of RelBE/YafQ-DinJ toxin-antitoxin module
LARPKSNKYRYNFLIDKGVYDDFSKVCEELGLVRSKKLEIFMKEFVEQNRKAPKKAKIKAAGGGRK